MCANEPECHPGQAKVNKYQDDGQSKSTGEGFSSAVCLSIYSRYNCSFFFNNFLLLVGVCVALAPGNSFWRRCGWMWKWWGGDDETPLP